MRGRVSRPRGISSPVLRLKVDYNALGNIRYHYVWKREREREREKEKEREGGERENIIIIYIHVV